MNGMITCSVKEAIKLMEHLDDNDMVVLSIIDKKSEIITYSDAKKIKKKKGKKLLEKADTIEYQDNDFFGRFSLYKTKENKIQNILFPQLE